MYSTIYARHSSTLPNTMIAFKLTRRIRQNSRFVPLWRRRIMRRKQTAKEPYWDFKVLWSNYKNAKRTLLEFACKLLKKRTTMIGKIHDSLLLRRASRVPTNIMQECWIECHVKGVESAKFWFNQEVAHAIQYSAARSLLND